MRADTRGEPPKRSGGGEHGGERTSTTTSVEDTAVTGEITVLARAAVDSGTESRHPGISDRSTTESVAQPSGKPGRRVSSQAALRFIDGVLGTR